MNSACFESRGGDDQVPCTSDSDCGAEGVCAPTGFCEAVSGDDCSVTADCPADQYCNMNLPEWTCVPLMDGTCREDSHCGGGTLCTATAGGVGRCVECLSGGDCSSGVCNTDGTCGSSGGSDASIAPDAGSSSDAGIRPDTAGLDTGGSSCTPACNTAAGETCQSGVCYGSNGCPVNAHPSGGGCVCDDGYMPNSMGTACVANPSYDGGTSTDAGTATDAGSSTDASTGCPPNAHVEADGYCYCNDGFVPDPTGTSCVRDTSYDAGTSTDTGGGGDGCPANSHLEADGYCYCDPGYAPDPTGTFCQVDGSGYDAGSGYDSGGGGDGCPANSHLEADGYCYCDAGYAPDPTGSFCESSGGGGGDDICAVNGWYGDGWCDDFCPSPDPDCGGGGGDDGCPANAHLESDGYCYCDAGYVPDASGATCVVDGGGGGGDDICAENGWYGDGWCDDFCPSPDPDCDGGGGGGDGCPANAHLESDGYCYCDAGFVPDASGSSCVADGGGGGGDICAENGWYGDGWCDDFCPSPDPDCGGGGGGGDGCPTNAHLESDGYCYCDAGYVPDASGASCVADGGGGGGSGDICEDNGWYGDGWCDDFCAYPDPDCGGGGGGGDGCPANAHLESDGYCYCDAGYVPDASGGSCVPDSGGGGSGDICEDNGWYGDGWCDDFCPYVDPDC